MNTSSGSIVASGNTTVSINVEDKNVVAVLVSGEFVGTLNIQGIMKDGFSSSEPFGINSCDAYALDGDVRMSISASAYFKVPVSGLSELRIYGLLESGAATVFMGAVEGAEVIQEILSYSDVLIKNSDPVRVTEEL